MLALMNPYTDSGTSLCLLDALGIAYCPGEGLGHSIAFTIRGDLSSAWAAHPIGPAAVGMITYRIMELWKKAFRTVTIFKHNKQYQ
ncbi:MAG: DUF2752 domain-containing protein [Balneolaceae bacterium]|nr:DUF2752 domain-containing protein [Balneolaceae bacterium]